MTRVDLLTPDGHDARDHSGIPGVGGGGGGGGSGIEGNVVIASPQGFDPNGSAINANVANRRYAIPIQIPGPMDVRALHFRIASSGAGTFQWGIFEYSDPAAATKVAGGSGVFGSTGWQKIDADSAPVTIPAGNYMLMFKQPSSGVPSLTFGQSNTPGNTRIADSDTWTDTPNFSTGWGTASSSTPQAFLKGDLGDGAQWL